MCRPACLLSRAVDHHHHHHHHRVRFVFLKKLDGVLNDALALESRVPSRALSSSRVYMEGKDSSKGRGKLFKETWSRSASTASALDALQVRAEACTRSTTSLAQLCSASAQGRAASPSTVRCAARGGASPVRTSTISPPPVMASTEPARVDKRVGACDPNSKRTGDSLYICQVFSNSQRDSPF